MSVGVMKRWWDKRVLTCRSCLAASAPARVWNVTKPTGCKGKEQKHILSLRRSCGWKVSNYFMPIMVAVGLLLTRAAGCCCSHKPSSASASIRTLQFHRQSALESWKSRGTHHHFWNCGGAIVMWYRKHLPMRFCHFCWSPSAAIPRNPVWVEKDNRKIKSDNRLLIWKVRCLPISHVQQINYY